MHNENETKMFWLAQSTVTAALSGRRARISRSPTEGGRPLTMTPRDGIDALELIALHTDQAPLRERAFAAIAAASAADHPGARRVAGAARAALKRLSERSLLVIPVA